MAVPDHYPGIDDEFEPHPYAEIFPMLFAEELEELANSIELQGQQTPVVLYQNKILDGRNRYIALCLLNRRIATPVKLIYGRFEHGQESLETDRRALDFVVVHNFHRRNLTVGQRAVIGLAIKEHYATILKAESECAANLRQEIIQSRSLSASKTAKDLGISTRAVEQARTIEKTQPELLEDVRSGKKSLNAAYREIKPVKLKEQKQIDLVVDFITNCHSLDEDEVISCLNSIQDNHSVILRDWVESTLFAIV